MQGGGRHSIVTFQCVNEESHPLQVHVQVGVFIVFASLGRSY